jgi:CO dehydrogenase maturation factor
VRIAVAGKGGAGKTTLSATLARIWARDGASVVAVDGDANPNLGVALGLAPGRDVPAALPVSLVSRRPGGTALTIPVAQVLDEHGSTARDGVVLLTMGAPAHADEGCLCSAHATVAALLADLGDVEGHVVVDMEASPEHLSRGTVRHCDVVVLVAEPYYRSLETVHRMAALAAELPVGHVAVVANKVRDAGDADAVREFCARHDLDLVGVVPWSEDVGRADRSRTPLVEVAADAAVVTAIRDVGRTLLEVAPAAQPR